MASSWGDERTSLRFRKTEIWLDVNDFDTMVEETQKLVERLETVRTVVTPTPAVSAPGTAVSPA